MLRGQTDLGSASRARAVCVRSTAPPVRRRPATPFQLSSVPQDRSQIRRSTCRPVIVGSSRHCLDAFPQPRSVPRTPEPGRQGDDPGCGRCHGNRRPRRPGQDCNLGGASPVSVRARRDPGADDRRRTCAGDHSATNARSFNASQPQRQWVTSGGGCHHRGRRLPQPRRRAGGAAKPGCSMAVTGGTTDRSNGRSGW